MNTLADRLHELMTARRLTQAQLADAAGVSQNAVHKLATGKSSRSRYIAEIAAALGTTTEWLTTGVGFKQRPAAAAAEQPDAQEIANMRLALIQRIASGAPEEIERITRILHMPVDDALPGLNGADNPAHEKR